MLAATSWSSALAEEPARALGALVAFAVVTFLASRLVHVANRRIRTLRTQVLVITLTALVLGALAAYVLAWLMLLDPSQLGPVLSVLAVAAVSATGLALLTSAPLGRDARSLEATVRRIEDGDRRVRTDIDRVDELGHVARALDELNERLEALEAERARFEAERSAMLSSVSHDLRTPIAALRAAIEALTDGLAPDPDRFLRSMQRDVEALTALVEDLFLLVRLDDGRVEMPASSIDLTEIADEAIEALAPVAADRGVSVVLDAPGGVRVEGNAAALGRVIRNLLDNALRHAPAGSVVTVAVDPAQRQVRVTDEGPGFPPAFVEEAFDHFTRADASRARDTGGAGLGLAIARGVVEAHGGRIWIDAPPGGHVTFELPAA